jgi:hypothetical protein
VRRHPDKKLARFHKALNPLTNSLEDAAKVLAPTLRPRTKRRAENWVRTDEGQLRTATINHCEERKQ